MNSQKIVLVFFTALFLIAPVLPVLAEEMVTIPKLRLEELERKEAELETLKANLTKTSDQNMRLQRQREADAAEQEKLKAELSKTIAQNTKLQKQREADAVKIASAVAGEPVVTHLSPPMASLPPLKKGEVVDAMDLANYYRADSAAADQRYRKHEFFVRGQVTGFDKPLFRSDYKLILKTADREIKVVCDTFPPDNYKAVFAVKNGSELVGVLADESRVPIVKIGDTVDVAGRCKGLSDSVVTMSGCELHAVH